MTLMARSGPVWRLGSLLWLAFSGALLAGDRPATTLSQLPGCPRGECQARHQGAARVQGALLQVAALSMVRGADHAPGSGRQLKDLPHRSKARLPSWYRRAQAAQVRSQITSVPRLRPGPVPPPARARVRQSPLAASARFRERAAPKPRVGVSTGGCF